MQATLNSMVYTPSNANADSTIVITTTVDDRSAGGATARRATGVDGNNIIVKTFNINVSNTNDAPVVTRTRRFDGK